MTDQVIRSCDLTSVILARYRVDARVHGAGDARSNSKIDLQGHNRFSIPIREDIDLLGKESKQCYSKLDS